MRTMTSRAFNQDTSQAKKAAAGGPVIITDRGKPAHVLMTFETYRALTKGGLTIGEALYMPGVAEIDLDSELPSRAQHFSRDVDLS